MKSVRNHQRNKHVSRSTFQHDLSHHHKSRQSPITSSHCSHLISYHTSSHITPHLTSHLSPHLNESSTGDPPHRLRFTTLGPIHRSLPSLIALDRSLPSLTALEPHCPRACRPCLCLLLGCPRRSSDPCQSARVEKLPHTPTQGLCSSRWASSALTKHQHSQSIAG